MNVEEKILKLIPKFLKAYDPFKKGTAVDIGVGTFNFYFEVFSKEGYNTVAVEPLPSENVINITNKLENTVLVEACILDYDGEVDIYTGVFNDNNLSDVSSVNQDWWGVSSEKSSVKKVTAMTFDKLIKENQINLITFCKIDTEGSEYSIIKQFKELEVEKYPSILEFEYGGGGSKLEGKAGWNEKYSNNIIGCISILFDLGYRYLLLFERENEKPIEIILNSKDNISDIFADFYVYGDILMMRDKKYNFDATDGSFSFDFEKTLTHKIKNLFK